MTTLANPEVIPEHVTRVNEAKTPTGPGRPGASQAHITASTEHLSVEDVERNIRAAGFETREYRHPVPSHQRQSEESSR